MNQSLVPLAVTDPILVRRRANEARFHAEVRELASRVALVAWSTQEESSARLDLVAAQAAAPAP